MDSRHISNTLEGPKSNHNSSNYALFSYYGIRRPSIQERQKIPTLQNRRRNEQHDQEDHESGDLKREAPPGQIQHGSGEAFQTLLVIALLATVFWNTVFFYARHSDTPLLLPLQTSDQLVSSPLPVPSLLPEDTRKPSLPIIAIIGRTGAGKSTFIKTLDGLSIGKAPASYSLSLETENASDTMEFTFYKFNYASKYGTAAWIIETPGLLDANLSDTDIMRGIRTTLDENRLDNRNIHMIYPYYLTLPKFNDEAHKFCYFQGLIGLDITGRIALVTTRQCLSDPVNIAVARCLRIGDFAEVAAWTVPINIRDAPPEASSSQSSYKIKASA
ncbi:uncharacterized protein RSE6_06027 [Rhynchosporium secalis]|uniref:Uncharacterized protein n=1 Tax=Rhynchosporium secalis TaxID=38038 RepID=A0A1E1M9C7_RHYSE|nr:uncharacterized protein RSE6_06027 [Rhynchosporium secalis]